MFSTLSKWSRFRLSTLFALMTACCLILGLWSAAVNPYRLQARSLAVVRSLNGHYSLAPAEGSNWHRVLVTTLLGKEAFTRVTNVNLANRNVDDQKLRSLAGLTRLEELTLDYNPITDVSMAVLSAMPHLNRLSLRYTKISDQSVQHLAKLPNLSRLTLTGTQFTDAAVAQFAKCNRLSELNIRWTRISETAAGSLAAALPECDIHHHALAAQP